MSPGIDTWRGAGASEGHRRRTSGRKCGRSGGVWGAFAAFAPAACAVTIGYLAGMSQAGAAGMPSREEFFDPEDGYVDVSRFLDRAYGFIPVVLPITEPARNGSMIMTGTTHRS